MKSGWLAIVSAEHVARGVHLGIAQVNHGKKAPLVRMRAGDDLIYYSPSHRRGIKDGYQSFTAIGTLPDNTIWRADEGDFKPYRRRIDYQPSTPVPINDLREQLLLTSQPNWGYQLRFGLIELEVHDLETIRGAVLV